MKESVLVQKTMKEIKARWPYSFVVKLSDRFTRGLPDILAIIAGRCLFVEVKTDIGTLSPIQLATHERIGLAGINTYVLRGPYQLEQLLSTIDKDFRRP